jgi:hypothetical protein
VTRLDSNYIVDFQVKAKSENDLLVARQIINSYQPVVK